MNFISERLKFSRNDDGGFPIMFSLRGETDLEEIELDHLNGYRGSKPVRIGNGAATHLQLDIYGELMDAIYLYNKYGKPVNFHDSFSVIYGLSAQVSWEMWIAVRGICDYVCTVWKEKGNYMKVSENNG